MIHIYINVIQCSCSPPKHVMVYATSAPLHDVTVISITAGSILPVLLRVTPVTSAEVIIWVTHSPVGYPIALYSAPHRPFLQAPQHHDF